MWTLPSNLHDKGDLKFSPLTRLYRSADKPRTAINYERNQWKRLQSYEW